MKADKLTWAGRAVTALTLFPFAMSVFFSLAKPEMAAEGMVKAGWPPGSNATILPLMVGSVTLYLIPQTAVLGAVLLTGYLGGAVATHLRVGEAPTAAVVVGVLAWLGLWLREPRLRQLMPLRR